MMIPNFYTDGGYWKGITVEQMQAILVKLPKDCLIGCNKVGNLMVADRQGVYLGYVDLLNNGEWNPAAE